MGCRSGTIATFEGFEFFAKSEPCQRRFEIGVKTPVRKCRWIVRVPVSREELIGLGVAFVWFGVAGGGFPALVLLDGCAQGGVMVLIPSLLRS
jgi:hypothetical protein